MDLYETVRASILKRTAPLVNSFEGSKHRRLSIVGGKIEARSAVDPASSHHVPTNHGCIMDVYNQGIFVVLPS